MRTREEFPPPRGSPPDQKCHSFYDGTFFNSEHTPRARTFEPPAEMHKTKYRTMPSEQLVVLSYPGAKLEYALRFMYGYLEPKDLHQANRLFDELCEQQIERAAIPGYRDRRNSLNLQKIIFFEAAKAKLELQRTTELALHKTQAIEYLRESARLKHIPAIEMLIDLVSSEREKYHWCISFYNIAKQEMSPAEFKQLLLEPRFATTMVKSNTRSNQLHTVLSQAILLQNQSLDYFIDYKTIQAQANVARTSRLMLPGLTDTHIQACQSALNLYSSLGDDIEFVTKDVEFCKILKIYLEVLKFPVKTIGLDLIIEDQFYQRQKDLIIQHLKQQRILVDSSPEFLQSRALHSILRTQPIESYQFLQSCYRSKLIPDHVMVDFFTQLLKNIEGNEYLEDRLNFWLLKLNWQNILREYPKYPVTENIGEELYAEYLQIIKAIKQEMFNALKRNTRRRALSLIDLICKEINSCIETGNRTKRTRGFHQDCNKELLEFMHPLQQHFTYYKEQFEQDINNYNSEFFNKLVKDLIAIKNQFAEICSKYFYIFKKCPEIKLDVIVASHMEKFNRHAAAIQKHEQEYQATLEQAPIASQTFCRM